MGTDNLAGYRGVTGQNPAGDIDTPVLNDWAYDRVGRTWNRYLGAVWAHSAAPANFDPHYATEDSAQRGGLVTAGKFIYDVETRKVRVITAYTGAAPSTLTYEWVAQNPGDGGESSGGAVGGGGFNPTLLGTFTPATSGSTRRHFDTNLALPDSGWLMLTFADDGAGSAMTATAIVSVAALRGLAAASTGTTVLQPQIFVGGGIGIIGFDVATGYWAIGHTAGGNITFLVRRNTVTPGTVSFYTL